MPLVENLEIAEIIQDLKIVSTGNICDADSHFVQIMDHNIQPLHHSMKVIGSAYTVECSGGDNLSIHQALIYAPVNSVLVINVHGSLHSGHIGDIISNACKIKGIRGIIIDGSCRDVAEIIQMQFPVFARGCCPRSNGKIQKGNLNKSTTCGGITINPGDIILGDASGIVTFPQNAAKKIVKRAREIAVNEVSILEQLHAGKTTLEIFNLSRPEDTH